MSVSPPIAPIRVESLVFGAPDERPPLTFQAPAGHSLCITGGNGSGKSHLLAILVGLATATSGEICFEGDPVPSPLVRRARAATMGVGFQHSGLIESLTVFQNASLPFRHAEAHRRHQLTESGITQLTRHRLEQLGIEEIASLYPHQLSNGERKAVALARALALSPRILLLDEPFLSLGAGLKHRAAHLLSTLLAEGSLETAILFACETIVLPPDPRFLQATVNLCGCPPETSR